MASQPRYVEIAQRKQTELAAAIPTAWQLPAHLVPEGMLSISESITVGPKKYQRVSVLDIPRTCGLLTPQELDITEKYDVRGLVTEMAEGRLKAEDVVRGFCKVCPFCILNTIANHFPESIHRPPTYPLPNRTALRPRLTASPRPGQPPPTHRHTSRTPPRPPSISERHIQHPRRGLEHRTIRASIQARPSERPTCRPAGIPRSGSHRQDKHSPNPRNTGQLQPPLRTHSESTKPPIDSRRQYRRRRCATSHARLNGRLWHGYRWKHPRPGDVPRPLRLQA